MSLNTKKMKTAVVFIMSSLLCYTSLPAHNYRMFDSNFVNDEVPENMIYDLDVEGVMMDSLMTKSQVIAKFGEPDEYLFYDYDIDGTYEWYHFGENSLLFINERLYSFSVSNTEWAILTNHFDVGVKVGDNIAKLSVLAPETNGESQYTLWCYEDFLMVINVNENDIITNINFTFRY